jgi:hypothetical protein
VQRAHDAILAGDVDKAVVFIDQARTSLLDRSADTHTFVSVLYEAVQELSTAKRLLSAKDYAASLHSLETALASTN